MLASTVRALIRDKKRIPKLEIGDSQVDPYLNLIREAAMKSQYFVNKTLDPSDANDISVYLRLLDYKVDIFPTMLQLPDREYAGIRLCEYKRYYIINISWNHESKSNSN